MLYLYLDAGHGLNTPGKRCPDDSMREFHFNHAIASKLMSKLANYDGVKCFPVYDTTGKVDTPLAERARKANQLYNQHKKTGVALYLSLHANAYGTGWNGTRGFETYIHPNAGSMTQEIQTALHYHILEQTTQRDRGLKKANFQVLRETLMSGVLLEAAFMTNKEDAALLKSEAYRDKYVSGIVKALEKHYKVRERVTVANNQPSSWAKESWEKAKELGITDGSRPQENITRQEVIVLLDRAGVLEKK